MIGIRYVHFCPVFWKIILLGQTKKYVCFRLPTVPKFRSPTLIFFIGVFGFFYNCFFSQKNVFSFQFIFVATYIKNNFSKRVFVAFERSGQHVSRDQTVRHHLTDWNWNVAVLFLQKVLQGNKIIAKNKKIIRPTYHNFKKHVTGNIHIFLFGLSILM